MKGHPCCRAGRASSITAQEKAICQALPVNAQQLHSPLSRHPAPWRCAVSLELTASDRSQCLARPLWVFAVRGRISDWAPSAERRIEKGQPRVKEPEVACGPARCNMKATPETLQQPVPIQLTNPCTILLSAVSANNSPLHAQCSGCNGESPSASIVIMAVYTLHKFNVKGLHSKVAATEGASCRSRSWAHTKPWALAQ